MDPIELLAKLMEDSLKSQPIGVWIAWVAANVIYYIILAFLVWMLGRRIVQGALYAWKESRHDNP